MSSSAGALPPVHAAQRRAGSSTCRLGATDLERFWPSRRGHAFDELCR